MKWISPLGVLACLLFAAPALAVAPANDDFADAEPTVPAVGLPASATGTNVDATREAGEPFNPWSEGGASIWFAWEADADGAVEIDTCGSDFDTILAVYTGGTLETLDRRASDDDGAGCDDGLKSEVVVPTDDGEIYWISVDGFNGVDGLATGDIALSLEVADPQLVVADDVEVDEGDVGPTDAVFDVILTEPHPGEVTVDFATERANATPGVDFEEVSGTLTFAPGETAKQVAVPVNGDTIPEPDEFFFLDIFDVEGAELGASWGLGAILNDDGPPPAISIGDVTRSEGNSGTTDFTFPVTLSVPTTGTVTVEYDTWDGTARSGSDYLTRFGDLTFAPGETSKSVTVPVVGDTTPEPDEVFEVELWGLDGAVYADDLAEGTILNDDVAASGGGTNPPPSDGGANQPPSGGDTLQPPSVTPSAAFCLVPNLKGKKRSAVEGLLEKAGCRLGKLSKKKAKKAKVGLVLSQSPAAGQRLDPGAKVSVVVGKKAKKK